MENDHITSLSEVGKTLLGNLQCSVKTVIDEKGKAVTIMPDEDITSDEDFMIDALQLGINDENILKLLQGESYWFNNICEVLKYTECTGKRLAQISCNFPNNFNNVNIKEILIESNSVLLMLLNLISLVSKIE
jgi:rRNA processing protein Krr1/Pno1